MLIRVLNILFEKLKLCVIKKVIQKVSKYTVKIIRKISFLGIIFLWNYTMNLVNTFVIVLNWSRVGIILLWISPTWIFCFTLKRSFRLGYAIFIIAHTRLALPVIIHNWYYIFLRIFYNLFTHINTWNVYVIKKKNASVKKRHCGILWFILGTRACDNIMTADKAKVDIRVFRNLCLH